MDQLVANLANAQHSTGPKTENGKHRTRLNACRHGLAGQICLLTAGEHAAFDQHCTGFRESLEPVGAPETELAQSYSKGEKYNQHAGFPQEILQIGSDFSSAGIRRLIYRNQRRDGNKRRIAKRSLLPDQPSFTRILIWPIALGRSMGA
jgi:hypothetical protein